MEYDKDKVSESGFRPFEPRSNGLTSVFDSIRRKFLKLSFYLGRLQRRSRPFSKIGLNADNNFKRRGAWKYLGVGILSLFVVFFLTIAITRLLGGDGRLRIAVAKDTEEIGREFEFPLRTNDGDIVGNVKYKIENAEIKDEIIIQGQKATAVEGRTFLIFTLKISNEYSEPIEINTRDYVRLSVNGNEEEWLAPDIHNDPVEVQAISTKNTRVGFPINESDSNLVLRIGEINGSKEKLQLSIK